MKKKHVILFIILVILTAFGISALILLNSSGKLKTGNPSPTPAVVSNTADQVPSPTPIPKPPTSTVSLFPPLSMTVTEPVNGTTVDTARITVKGTTTPKAEVFVNDAEVTADAKGNFTAKVTLEEGENYILVVSNDENGSSAEQEIMVTYVVE